MTAERSTGPWWVRPGLDVRGGRLHVAGHDAEAVARRHGTPLYVIDVDRASEQARKLRRALESAGLRGLVRLALKAQREPELLAHLRSATPYVGLDVCSPNEIDWGISNGWAPSEISYTGTNVSERDLDRVLASGVHVNVDLLSQLERVGRRSRRNRIGIRVNPRQGAGYEGEAETLYSGRRPTKFGIFPEQFGDVVELARHYELELDTVHFHTGDGYLTDGLPVFEEVVTKVAAMTRTLLDAGCPITEINTGGGLGVPQRAGDETLDLDRWAAILARHLGPIGVTVACEPGDFLTKECSVHLAEVVTVEERDGVRFVGLDTGWNVMNEHFVYRSPLEIVVCRAADAPPAGNVTIAGNINEGDDLFAEVYPFPEVREGDIVAALNVGSYNASMTSSHCLRGPVPAVCLRDRRPPEGT